MNMSTTKSHTCCTAAASRRDSAGFTLIELMIVIAVALVLAGIGFPMLSKWVSAYQLKGAAQILYADLQKAKLHAIKTNRNVIFTFIAVPDCSTPTGYTFTDSNGTIVASNTMADGICIHDSNFIASSGFSARGLQNENTPAQRIVKIKHVDRTREYVITQNMAGSITIK